MGATGRRRATKKAPSRRRRSSDYAKIVFASIRVSRSLGVDVLAEPGEAEIDAVVDRIVIDERAAALDIDHFDVVGVQRLGGVIQVGDVDLDDLVLVDVEIQDPRRLRLRLQIRRWSATRWW